MCKLLCVSPQGVLHMYLQFPPIDYDHKVRSSTRITITKLTCRSTSTGILKQRSSSRFATRPACQAVPRTNIDPCHLRRSTKFQFAERDITLRDNKTTRTCINHSTSCSKISLSMKCCSRPSLLEQVTMIHASPCGFALLHRRHRS